jgi:hypothetical protein
MSRASVSIIVQPTLEHLHEKGFGRLVELVGVNEKVVLIEVAYDPIKSLELIRPFFVTRKVNQPKPLHLLRSLSQYLILLIDLPTFVWKKSLVTHATKLASTRQNETLRGFSTLVAIAFHDIYNCNVTDQATASARRCRHDR